MTDPRFLAQAAHSLAGYGVLLTARLFGVTPAAAVLFPAYCLVKEFWFDQAYETPPQTFAGSSLDFAFYLAGAAAGLLVGLLA